jgi:cytochrome c-type biogenesis protein CcmH/NrfG
VTVTKTVVVDTNVLLSNPAIIRELDGADVVIPETVLSELDKLKTARVDPDLRFKGREVSRNLFELSEQGLLAEGVELPSGGELRVVPFDLVGDMPEELSSRNADDRIVAVAYDLMKQSEDNDVYLLTADLNMLIKAQSLGIPVQRFRTEDEQSVARRYIIRPFQRYRVPLAILAIAVAVFAGIVYVAQLASRPGTSASIPVEFTDQLVPQQQQILTYLLALQENPSDVDTAKKLGDLYFELWSDPQTRAPIYAIDAIKHYQDVLRVRPDDLDVRTDLAAIYFYNNQADAGIKETLRVLQADPQKVQANYNLGLMYWKGRQDLKAAAAQFEKVVKLTNGGDLNAQGINRMARESLSQIVTEAAAAGIKIKPSIPATPTNTPAHGSTGTTTPAN